MELWIATGNKGKLEEYKLSLSKIPHAKIFSLADLSSFTPKPENGTTFLENARIKAKTLKALKPNAWVLGEDSGLEVEGLGNLPGIHSARYAGPHARDSENIAKLLKMMQIRNISNRNAQFQCAVVVYTPENEEWTFQGQLQGQLSAKATGLMGFGYDPIFVPGGQTKTLAELGPGYKIQNSHRAIVIQQFISKLNEKGA